MEGEGSGDETKGTRRKDKEDSSIYRAVKDEKPIFCATHCLLKKKIAFS
jgi:hypothetical protein